MADIYRVIYNRKHPDNQNSQLVLASSQDNAIAAVKTADKKYVEVVTVTMVMASMNILVGS